MSGRSYFTTQRPPGCCRSAGKTPHTGSTRWGPTYPSLHTDTIPERPYLPAGDASRPTRGDPASSAWHRPAPRRDLVEK
ncbi:hypothetical protein FMEAI12_2130016 [Parafrankia sp. Ea1.12]|nr:hypothetical protein FMEAI12_2130016 [Parafrankia sp. Ea1.12]